MSTRPWKTPDSEDGPSSAPTDPWATPGSFPGGPFHHPAGTYPGSEGPLLPPGDKPPTHLPWAILATVLCCMPTGILAIVFAIKADSAWDRGDAEGARSAGSMALKWAVVSAGLFLFYVIFLFSLSGI